MIANRFLGNPTDRDDNGGLWNRVCHGSRTEAAWETERTATVPYRACAPHFYPNNLRLLRPEGSNLTTMHFRAYRIPGRSWSWSPFDLVTPIGEPFFEFRRSIASGVESNASKVREYNLIQ
jgi:hypothetical protein